MASNVATGRKHSRPKSVDLQTAERFIMWI